MYLIDGMNEEWEFIFGMAVNIVLRVTFWDVAPGAP
jgi:hypothetical protein